MAGPKAKVEVYMEQAVQRFVLAPWPNLEGCDASEAAAAVPSVVINQVSSVA